MAEQMSWKEAILAVLHNQPEAMHYTEIADEIIARGLRTDIGATPNNTVSANISDSLRDMGTDSPFDRTSRGHYRLRQRDEPSANHDLTITSGELAAEEAIEEAKETTGLINALGMYWSRDEVVWAGGSPRLFGRQAAGSEPVDLSDQRGVYLLYDRNDVIYVGRAIDQGIGTRLKQHTFDRLSSRWDRFSWFGVFSVSGTGELRRDGENYDRALLIATMEALLIESVEPSQNRRRGDDFRAVEFLQADDPEVETARMRGFIAQMQSKLGL